MSYSYAISFNSSDYSELIPSNEITMTCEWVQDTFIWREKISEVKIDKALNSTIFDTLNTWFIDPTKFETKIWVKRLKNNVQDSLHWFGIKWGQIDTDLTSYIVKPTPYDL